jgi:hypothetical protein
VKHEVDFLPGVVWVKGELSLLTPEFMFVKEFARAGDLSNPLRARGGSWNVLPQKGNKTLAESRVIALIRLGKVPPKLTGEPANCRGKTFHAIIRGFE